MLENLLNKYNGVLLESKYVEPEYTIEEVITELNKVGIKVDANKEEGATIIDNTAYTWNISEACIEFSNKSIEDKIAGSSYKDQIQVEIDAHPGCLLSEFIDI